jgi:hypothetical protein
VDGPVRAPRRTDRRPEHRGLTAVGTPATALALPVVAGGAHDRAASIVDTAARPARDTGSPLEVVHVRQTAVVGGQAVDTEARRAVTARIERPAGLGIAATGRILTGVGDRTAAGPGAGPARRRGARPPVAEPARLSAG